MKGGKNRLNYGMSGVARKADYSSGQSYIVPKSSVRSPLNNRPSNEPRAVSRMKNAVGINDVQGIYKP